MKISKIDQLRELKDLFKNYPNFVHSNKLKSIENEIPVFVFHTIDPKIFEEQLEYLKKNNYNTLSINEFYNIIEKKEKSKPNSVLLTVDDARTSFWKYAYPLLKKYNSKATLFVIPGSTREGNKKQNLHNVWNSEITEKQLKEIDINDDQLCVWSENKEMYDSGFVDIESHSLFHKDVFVDKNLLGFINHNSSFRPFDSCYFPYLTFEDIGETIQPNNYYGLPLFKTDSLMKAPIHYKVSNELKKICKEINLGFDENTSFERRKNELIKNIGSVEKHLELIKNPVEELTIDLAKSREIIKNQLDGNAGNHLCLPWTLGNNLTIEVAKKVGLKTCFWGVLDNKKINKPGDNPFNICRIKNDFIFRLPGEGRISLNSIYLNKIKRRLKSEPIY